VHSPDSEDEPDEDKFVHLDPIEKVWDLTSDKIFISKRLVSRAFTTLEEGEEINISYGERANSFLLIEYGFTIPENRYDFVRMKKLTVNDIFKACDELGLSHAKALPDEAEVNLATIKMNPEIRVDLKLSGLHRDLLRLIRCSLKP
jgi:hypothetical protein